MKIEFARTISRLMESLDLTAFKITKGAFTQEPVLTPLLIVSLVVCMAASPGAAGYAPLLIAFWSKIHVLKIGGIREEMVTASAFCTARKKLKARLWFALALDVVKEVKAKRGTAGLWHGLRPVAVDGTRLTLPRAKALRKQYGTAAGGKWPQATMTMLCDVRRRMPVNLTLGPAASSERVGLAEIMGSLSSEDILLADRGFPSIDVLRDLLDRNIHFLMRLAVGSSFAQVTEFARSGRRDCTINLERKHKQPGDRPLRVRLVRSEVPGAEPHILVTSVPRNMATSREMGRLYRERWQIEELFKLWKHLAPVSRQFHSKLVAGIEQEVGARFLHLAICAAYFATTETENDWVAQGKRVRQKDGISCIDEFLVLIFLSPRGDSWDSTENYILGLLRRSPYKLRPGRSSPRVSITPMPRWAAGGRTSRRKKRKRAPIPRAPRRHIHRKAVKPRAKTR